MKRAIRLWLTCLAASALCAVGLPASAGPLRPPAVPSPAWSPPRAAHHAAADAVLTIGSADVQEGGSATVSLEAALDTYSLGGATVKIEYDPAVVDATACDADPEGVFSLALCNVNYAENTVFLLASSTGGVTGSPVLADITFVAVGTAGQTTALTLTPTGFYTPYSVPIPVSVEDGQIRIVGGGGLPAPSDLAAAALSASEIHLTWTDNSADETAFHVERSPDGTAGWAELATVAAGVTSFDDTGLACASDYYYRVRAYRAADDCFSGYSNVDGDTTGACVGDCLLTIDSAQVQPGQNARVSLSASLAAYKLGAATVEIRFDPAVVNPVLCVPDPQGVLDWAECNVEYAPDKVAFSAIALAGATGSPVLAEIVFAAIGVPGQDTPLELTPTVFVDPAGDPLPVSVEHGTIAIVPPAQHIYLPLVLNEHW